MAAVLLIPGAGGDPGYWYRLTPLIAAAGHSVVAVDLPDHDGVTLSDQVDAVVRAAPAGPGPLVVVAQSMGAQLGPAVCDRLPVALLVYLNPMIPAPGETAGAWWSAVGQGEAQRTAAVADGRDPDVSDPAVIFFHDLPPDVLAVVLSGAERPPAPSLFTSAQPTVAYPAVPTRVIVGRDDRLFPVELQRRVSRERLGVQVDVIPGGHLVALSRPAELAARLLGVIDSHLPTRSYRQGPIDEVSRPAADAETAPRR